MKDIILDTIIDSIKLVPFLLITFFIMEYIEHKFSGSKLFVKKTKIGPILGSIVGALPQCGFSVAATNFYVTRVISLGTLISVYLSTSDEMFAVMVSSGIKIDFIIKILLIKIVIGMICGFLIDLFIRKNNNSNNNIEHFCDKNHCNCKEKNILISSLVHTIKTIIFIFIITLIFNTIIYFLDKNILEKIFFKNNFISLIISSLIGLIPSCAASILIVELYLNKIITFGALLSGLLTGSGVGLLVLLKENKNLKENIFVIFLIFFIGIIVGFIFDILNLVK